MPNTGKEVHFVRARGRRSLAVSAENLIFAVKTILNEGLEDEFIQACSAANVSLNVPPATINFLKGFVVERTSANTAGTAKPKAIAKGAKPKSMPKAASARNLADCDECR